MASKKPHLSSLPLQIILYFSGWYLFLFYVAELALVIYKSLVLPYPARNLASEIILLVFLAVLDMIRIFLGFKGNLTERRLPLLISLVFIVPIFFGYLYLTVWQTYVLRLELVFLSIAYFGIVLESLLGIFTLWVFQKYDSLG